jgi:outer membrane protein assembly factor BamB
VVYVGSVSPGTIAGGALHAVDANTGIERWRLFTNPGDGVFSSPAVANGIVVVGSYDGVLVAADSTSGAELWRFNAEATFYASAAIVEEIVYASDFDGHLYAIELATGRERWRSTEGRGFDRILSAPALADGRVFGHSASKFAWEPASLVAWEAASGLELWRFTPRDEVPLAGAPVVFGDRVFLPTIGSIVYAVSVATGVEEGRFDLGVETYTNLAVVDGTIYVGSIDGALIACDAEDGELIWSQPLSPGINMAWAPVVADGLVYIGDAEGVVFGVDAATGEMRLRVALRCLRSSAAIIDGNLYIGSNNGYLRSVTGSEQAEVTPVASPLPG